MRQLPISSGDLRDAQMLWDYHQPGERIHRADVGIGLGSHDVGVPRYVAQLYHAGMFPLVVFTGANAPTTIDRFPRGEAVHFRDEAITLGVPRDAILIETEARNTVENIQLTRQLLHQQGVAATSAVLVSRPYQQRYAYGITRRQWPELEVTTAGEQAPMTEYMAAIGDQSRVIHMMVGDLQRIAVTADQGLAIQQTIPEQVLAAYRRLVAQGFTDRLIPNELLS